MIKVNTKQTMLDLKEYFVNKYPTAKIDNPKFNKGGDADTDWNEWILYMRLSNGMTIDIRIDYSKMDRDSPKYELSVRQEKGLKKAYRRTAITIWDINFNSIMEILRENYNMK